MNSIVASILLNSSHQEDGEAVFEIDDALVNVSMGVAFVRFIKCTTSNVAFTVYP